MSARTSESASHALGAVRCLPAADFRNGCSDLRWFGSKAVRSLRDLLAEDAFGKFELLSWSADRDSIEAFFGCSKSGHSLSTLHHAWLHPLERQITEGIAHFLNVGSDRQQRARALAFLRALDPPRGREWPEALSYCHVVAEESASGDGMIDGRIDLLVSALDMEGRRVGAVLEAKLEAKLGRNPLETYERQAKLYGLSERNTSFLVIGTRNDATTRKELASHPGWGFQSWRRLLGGLDRELRLEFDDDEFRRFRSTLFRRCI